MNIYSYEQNILRFFNTKFLIQVVAIKNQAAEADDKQKV